MIGNRALVKSDHLEALQCNKERGDIEEHFDEVSDIDRKCSNVNDQLKVIDDCIKRIDEEVNVHVRVIQPKCKLFNRSLLSLGGGKCVDFQCADRHPQL